MSRWASAAAAGVLAAALGSAAPTHAADDLSAAALTGDALSLGGDVLTLPQSTLDGGVEFGVEGLTLPTDVLFAFDSARLDEDARGSLDIAAAAIERRGPVSLRVVGHTDARGTADYNLRLSRRRAEAVRRALLDRLGSQAPTLRAEGRGEHEPLADEDTDGSDPADGRARNRRVELVAG